MSEFPLSTIRHSASHVLAQAVLNLFPEAKLAIGPSIEDGFYYDFDLPRTLTDEDIKVLEKDMKRIIKDKQRFEQRDLNRSEALAEVQKTDQNYKVEIIEELDLDEYSFYENGPFVDLCRGPHVEHTGQIGYVKLLRYSGAYWRGDEKNKMLQRIYGTAFASKEELKDYLTQLEEAKKRDHRKLGKDLDLFTINEKIGAGLVLWHPKGSMIRHLIETFWKDEHFKHNYQLLHTPHIGKAELWETSGHLDFYEEGMFSPVSIDEQDYYLKPMNCPFHIGIFNAKKWSYRELPLRLAELGTVYRFERSGVLHGLFRVRGFTQDDAHIFCSHEDMHSEIQEVLRFCMSTLKVFGFQNYKIFISTKPEEKSVGSDADWTAAETALKQAVDELGIDYDIDEGGGAFYGPKIDIKIEDAIGRQWQCSTIQFDFNLPERFDLTYTGSDGQQHRPFMVHRALFGSIERFFGILIEHYAGRFPLWLAPVQLSLLPIKSDFHDYCKEVQQELKAHGIRCEVDFSSEKLGYKIRQAQTQQVPYMIVVGQDEVDSGELAVRSREKGDLGKFTLKNLIEMLDKENRPADFSS